MLINYVRPQAAANKSWSWETTFSFDGKINSGGGEELEGMPRFQVLKAKGHYRSGKNNEMLLKICSRS